MTDVAAVVRTFAVADHDGLHARPCTRVARAAGKFRCDVVAEFGGRTADAKSVLELLGLNAPGGALVLFSATGPDAAACVDAVGAAMRGKTPDEAR